MAEQTILMGRRIAEAREAAGLTQAELAALIPGKADGTQVSKWERGIHRPSDNTLEHIAHALNREVVCFLLPEPAERTETPIPFPGAGETQLNRMEQTLIQLQEQVQLLRAELAARDAEALQRTAEERTTKPATQTGRRPTRRS